jgi:TFIIF-interacting CTD phosphatase-like protein
MSHTFNRPKTDMIRNVILDLDETIISTIETKDLKEDKSRMQNYKSRIRLFTFHIMDKDYIVTERPGVQEFLDFLFAHFNVSVWTAATKDYALYVVENVILTKPNRKLDYICHSYHCDLSRATTGCIKHLSSLFYHFPQYNARNTVLIDDNPKIVPKQPNEIINVVAFDFYKVGSEQDTELKNVTTKLKTYLATNVRL